MIKAIILMVILVVLLGVGLPCIIVDIYRTLKGVQDAGNKKNNKM